MSSTAITRYHILVFVGCWLGGMFDGMDSTFMSAVQPKAVGELIAHLPGLDKNQIASFINSAFLFGWMAGGILFGMIGDKLGRVRSMLFSIFIYALFTGLAGLSQEWWHLAVFRFLTGLGIGGELVSITTFLSEVWVERSRAIAIGILITSYQAGVLIAGFITRQIPSWRWVFFIGAAPAFLTILLRATLKESDKWKEAGTQSPEHSHGGVSLLGDVLSPVHRRNAIIGAVAFGGLLIGYWASLAWIPQWIQAFFTEQYPGNIERGNALIVQGFCAVVGCASAGFISDRIGRRYTIMLSYAGCFAASALLFLTNTTFTARVYWEIGALGYFIGLAQAIMYIYLPELFPTRIRATAVGFSLNAGRLATAIAVLFVGTIVTNLGGYANAALFFAGSYIIAVVAAFFAVETRGKGLPD
ncbi:MAG: MFS transporter [Candidatus Kapabacteria bacterium]|nr:MFS transporter [Candidatus Kapabacteria bacterium]